VLGIPAGVMVVEVAGWPASFAGLALLGFVSATLIALQFPRMTIVTQRSFLAEAALLCQPAFLTHLLLSGVLFAAMFAGYTYIAVFLGGVAGVDGVAIGWMSMGFGLAGLLGNWTAGRVVDRDPLAATAWVALALALGMALIGFVGGNPALLMLPLTLWGAAHTATFVLCQVGAMAAGQAAPAFAMSLNISVCNVGIAVGAIIGGWIVDSFGAGAPTYGGAVIAAGALVLALWMIAVRRRSHSTN
jgi:DHA1 family inner membrane transport protein